VRVETSHGSAVLESGYLYLESTAPAVSTLDPVRGDVAGGDHVDATGSNFPVAGSVVVVFGSAVASAVTLDSATHFSMVTPAHDYGPVDVTINFGEGQIQVLEGAFTFWADLTVTQILPNVGPTTGGTDVLLLGTGLVEGANLEVFFGDNLSDPESYILQGEQAAVVVPPGAEGPVDVVVAGDNGSVTIEDGFRYGTPLLVESLEPVVLPLAGGPVTLTGTGIETDATFSIQVGERFASDVQALSPIEMTFTAPAQDEVGVYDLLIAQDDQQTFVPDALTYE
jgi:hypothetical protein